MEILTFTNSIGESVLIKNSAPYLLEKVEGLGSPQARLITSKAVGQDGDTYHDTLMEGRDIRLEVAILAKSNIELFEFRRSLNRIFNPKLKEGILEYENDYGKWNIIATSVQAPIEGEKFSSSQKMLIHLRCSNPFWRSPDEHKSEIALWVGDLEFPIDIPSTGMEFGHRVSNLIVNIYNNGDVASGMRIEFKALASVVNPSLININTGEYIKINQTLIKNDRLIINTEFGNKKVDLIRNNVTYNVFNFIDLSSEFLQLKVGDNKIRYDAEEGIDNLECSIYTRTLFIGV